MMVIMNALNVVELRMTIVNLTKLPWTLMNKRNKLKKVTYLKDISLMLAMFFLPFGYDFLFKMILDATGSYWAADITFYCISGCFWLSYMLFSRYQNKLK